MTNPMLLQRTHTILETRAGGIHDLERKINAVSYLRPTEAELAGERLMVFQSAIDDREGSTNRTLSIRGLETGLEYWIIQLSGMLGADDNSDPERIALSLQVALNGGLDNASDNELRALLRLERSRRLQEESGADEGEQVSIRAEVLAVAIAGALSGAIASALLLDANMVINTGTVLAGSIFAMAAFGLSQRLRHKKQRPDASA